jgi:hypothetical protein
MRTLNGFEDSTDNGYSTGAMVMESVRECLCGCGESLAHKRTDAFYATDACRKRFERSQGAPRAFPRYLSNEARELLCLKHNEIYLQVWEPSLGVWARGCRPCDLEHKFGPAVRAEADRRLPEVHERVRAALESRCEAIDKRVAAKLEEQIPFVRQDLLAEEIDIERQALYEQFRAEMDAEILAGMMKGQG